MHGWYIAPSLQHYRCVRCYVPTTRSELVSDTIKFLPEYVPIPSSSIDDYVKAAMEQLIKTLKIQTNSKKLKQTSTPITAYLQVAKLLNNSPALASIKKAKDEQQNHNFEKSSTPSNHHVKEIATKPKPIRENRNKKPPKKKRNIQQPISDEEFERILQKLRQPKPTSEGEKTQTKPLNDNHCNDLAHNNYISMNIPTPKTSPNYMIENNEFKINHMYDNTTGRKQSIDSLLKSNPKIWEIALSNELGRLAQGIRDVTGNNVMDFIKHTEVPKDRIVTYSTMVCDICPLKTEKFRVRLTVGGNQLQYPDDTSSPAATLHS